MRTSGPREPIQEALGPVGLVAAPDLVELLPGVPHEPTGLADVAQVLGNCSRLSFLRAIFLLVVIPASLGREGSWAFLLYTQAGAV